MSAILESVLAAILLDMINAQNQANIRSAQLAREYIGKNRDEELLKFFNVPSAFIKSFDFELKFGLESVVPLLGENIGNKLPDLINSRLTEFVRRCMEGHQLPAGSENELKDFIAFLWKDNSDPTMARPGFEVDSVLIEEINSFITALKKEIRSLTDSELFLAKEERTPGLKAVLNVSDLSSYNGGILCSINVNAEIARMKTGYIDKIDKSGGNPVTSRQIFLVRS